MTLHSALGRVGGEAGWGAGAAPTRRGRLGRRTPRRCGADGRLEGGFPSGVDLDHVEQRAHDAIDPGQQLGAGRVLAQDAASEAIGALTHEMLTTATYHSRAKAVAKQFSGVDGAVGAADEVEALLARGAGRDEVAA